jgi:hypothetical protein
MKLFYAQSGDNKVTVTAPFNTFASKSSFDALYGVKPYAYTDGDGKRHEFKSTDFQSINYYPQNSGHYHIEILFSASFQPKNGATLHLKAMFESKAEQVFTLPYVKQSSVKDGEASVQQATIAITRESTISLANTAYKVYVNSQLVETKTIQSKAFSGDINLYQNPADSVIEFVGVTSQSELISQYLSNNKGKFLTSSDFLATINNESSYFYIFADRLSTEPFVVANKVGCLDTTASNYNIAAIPQFNNNSCIYDHREPKNVVITTTVASSKFPNITITYTETNLNSSSYNSTANFTSSVSINGATATTLVSTVNVENDTTTLFIKAENAPASSNLDSLIGIDLPFANIVVLDNVNSEDRSFFFPTFRSMSGGCVDNTALNYEAGATPCANCCLYCDDLVNGLQSVVFPGPEGFSSAGGVLAFTNDDATTVYGNIDITFQQDNDFFNDLSNLLTGMSNTYWTINYYNLSQVVLPQSQGEQATISGAALINDTNDAGSAAQIQFVTPPSNNSGLFPGNQYYAEYIFNNGSGCTFYAYALFVIPYNGCLDPVATNYIQLPGNTGLGTCVYGNDQTDCTQSIISSVTLPVLGIGNDYALSSLTILGQASDGVNPDVFGQYTVLYSLYDLYTGVFIGTYVVASNVVAGPGNTFNSTLAIPPNTSATITITELNSGCSEVHTIYHPGIIQIFGCTDPLAVNYNSTATAENGSCLYCDQIGFRALSFTNATGGCSTSNSDGTITFVVTNAPGTFYIVIVPLTAPAYSLPANQLVATNLSAGIYTAQVVVTMGPGINCIIDLDASIGIGSIILNCGCTNPLAINFDPAATQDNGTCIILGCIDPLAVNFNPNANVTDGFCIYSADPIEPACIPNSVDNTNTYDVTLNNIRRCLSREGTTLLFKIRGGVKCDTTEQIKITLVTYLLGRLGLDCLYNCNYTFQFPGLEIDCEALWTLGGPSGPELEWDTTTIYAAGDMVRYTSNGITGYYTTIEAGQALLPPPAEPLKWILCTNSVLPSSTGTYITGTETYLNTFINFARKFCLVCFSDPLPIAQSIIVEGNLLGGITLENGDNIQL